MTTTATPATGDTMSTEQKIDYAVSEAAKVTNLFAPVVGQALTMGVAVEPIFSGVIQMFIGLFHHHMKNPPQGN